MKRRPLRAALLVALAGPMVGVLPVIVFILFITASRPWPRGGSAIVLRLIEAVLTTGYMIGAIPAVTAALLVAYGIARRGWIDRLRWTYMTLFIGAGLPTLLYGAGLLFTFSSLPWTIETYLALTVPCLLATIFASLILRFVIIRLGWMKREMQPVWEVF